MSRSILTLSMIALLAAISWADEPEQERGDQGRQRNPERRVDAQPPRPLDRPRDAAPQREADRPRDAAPQREADRPRDGDRARHGDRARDGGPPRNGDRDRDAQRRPEQNHDRMVVEMRERLEQLRRMQERLSNEPAEGIAIDAVRQQIERTEQQLAKLTQRDRGQRDREHDEREEADRQRQQNVERLEHLHIAAEHLDRAGLNDAARDVRSQAEELERNLREHRRDGEPQGELQHMVHEMRERIEALSREVTSLRGDVDRMRRN